MLERRKQSWQGRCVPLIRFLGDCGFEHYKEAWASRPIFDLDKPDNVLHPQIPHFQLRPLITYCERNKRWVQRWPNYPPSRGQRFDLQANVEKSGHNWIALIYLNWIQNFFFRDVLVLFVLLHTSEQSNVTWLWFTEHVFMIFVLNRCVK